MYDHSRPRRRSQVIAQRVSDRLVLLDSETGAYYSLDGVGVRLWELCDGSNTVTEAVAAICAEYDADAATVADDVREVLNELVRERLIEEHSR
jgi:hypothetical protein